MTPPARLQAAIDVLAAWYDGAPIEKALTNWARGARYAGSKDRAAVRDIVFDCLRKRMYFNALSGLPDSARGLVIGHVAHGGGPVCEMFTEGGYGPAPLSAEERALLAAPKPEPVPQEGLECPDWMAPEMARSLGADAAEIVALMHARAPVFLRVNALKSDVAQAQSRLASDKIETRSHPLSPHALEVVSNPRRVASSAAFKEGLIELQDAASQAVVDVLPLPRETGKPLSVLDYCAGGGGKSLALAAKFRGPIVASDIKRDRMKDIPARAARAGADVVVKSQAEVAQMPPFDLVFCDAPCSGSGAWRRNPEGKWRLTEERAAQIRDMQRDVLRDAAKLVAENGALAYATCSVFRAENEDQIAWFLAEHPGWRVSIERRFSPLEGGDGFYVAHLIAF